MCCNSSKLLLDFQQTPRESRVGSRESVLVTPTAAIAGISACQNAFCLSVLYWCMNVLCFQHCSLCLAIVNTSNTHCSYCLFRPKKEFKLMCDFQYPLLSDASRYLVDEPKTFVFLYYTAYRRQKKCGRAKRGKQKVLFDQESFSRLVNGLDLIAKPVSACPDAHNSTCLSERNTPTSSVASASWWIEFRFQLHSSTLTDTRTTLWTLRTYHDPHNST